jgi:hypothetical protein
MSLFPIISPVSIVGYRYLRITVTANVDSSYADIREMKWFVDTTDYPTEAMTANDAPSPLVASARGEALGGGGEAYRAYDNGTVIWADDQGSLPSWLKIDLGAGNEIDPTSCKITGSAGYNRSPIDFLLEGSNDDSDWTTLKDVSSESGWSSGEERTYTIP